MKTKITLDEIYAPSDDIVAREIEGELIIVPLVSGIGNMEDELYTLSETGKAIWNKLDGKSKLKDVAVQLLVEFKAHKSEIEEDVIGLMEELKKRKMVKDV